MKGRRHLLWVLALGLLIAGSPAAGQDVLQATIQPPTIGIDAVYNGGELQVSGQLPSDCEAAVRIMGERTDLHLKKKGRVGGILWMNLDTITVQNVPAVFMIFCAKEFGELLGPHPELSGVRKLGMAFLQEQTKIIPESAEYAALFKEFLKLKQSEGLYGTSQGLLRYPVSSGTQKSFEIKIAFSARFPPGRYQVEVYAVRGGEVVAQTNLPLEVKMVGFPGLLARFAFNNGALYGLFAVAVAIVSGLIIGVVFSGSKGGSH
jgi:uncharacterized protein (TIGR02186 family)